jgi:hypothetical protein
MKLFLLMVLFSTPDTQEPNQVHGYGSRPADTLAQCLTRRQMLEAQLKASQPRAVRFTVFCVRMRAEGYEEAAEAFRRELRDPS